MTYSPCDRFISQIVRAADNGLPEEEQRQLDAHVANCAGCRDALADQRAVHMTLVELASTASDNDGSASTGASTGFEAAVMNALRAEVPWADRWNWRVWTWRLVPIAAVFALVAVGVVRNSTSPSSQSASAANASGSSLDLASLGSTSGQAPVASALWSSDISDASLLSLVLTAKADDPLAAHIKDK